MANTSNYSATIKESSKELTARERIKMKDTTKALSLDDETKVADVIITPESYAVISVHNEKADIQDYEKYVVVDQNGTHYITGSESFWKSFKDIWDEMENENEEYSIIAYRMPSSNYKDKAFITCSIM